MTVDDVNRGPSRLPEPLGNRLAITANGRNPLSVSAQIPSSNPGPAPQPPQPFPQPTVLTIVDSQKSALRGDGVTVLVEELRQPCYKQTLILHLNHTVLEH